MKLKEVKNKYQGEWIADVWSSDLLISELSPPIMLMEY